MNNNLQHILYLSYDGIDDAIGKSQILPYLKGLSKVGFHIHLISTEKKTINYETIKFDLVESNIIWQPIKYHKSPPVLSTIYDIIVMYFLSKKIIKKNNISIIHCRGYITAILGLLFKKKKKIKFLFDMRGFFADERVEGGLWNRNNIMYNKIYKWFKNKEKEFFVNADYIISLTERGKEIICNNILHAKLKNIEVIPCCVDLKKFDFNKFSELDKNNIRKELNINNDDLLFTYIGSIGTWYMIDEMLHFFETLNKKYPKSMFLVITNNNQELLKNKIKSQFSCYNSIIVTSKQSLEIPKYLAITDWGLFFIKPVFSKSASSPTKLAEFFAMGIPVITNKGVGDVDAIINNSNAGLLLNDFNDTEYNLTINNILSFKRQSANYYNNISLKYFNKDSAIIKYSNVYNKLLKK